MRQVFSIVVLAAVVGCKGATETLQVAAVQITTASATLRPGEISRFTAIAVDRRGVVLNAAGPVAWSSDAPAVATVDSAGVVRAVATGTATISATVQGVSGSRLVTVLPSGIGAVVTMPGFSFVPYQVTIRAGQQVYFEFPQTPHNVIFNRKPGAPADIQETRNRSVARQFDVAGSFEYDCTLHPGMSGLVVVNP